MLSKITEIFYLADEFCKELNKDKGNVHGGQAAKKNRNSKLIPSDSKLITIMILLHLWNYRTFKNSVSIINKNT